MLAVWTFAPGRHHGEALYWPTRYGVANGGDLGTYLELVLIQTYGFILSGLWLAWRPVDRDSWIGRVVPGWTGK